MGYLAGFIVAIFWLGLASVLGFARNRAFQATVLMVSTSYYVLFAATGSDAKAFVAEFGIEAAFITAAIVGFKRWPWVIVLALASHGLFDAVHHRLVDNPGVPVWWPAFCAIFDLTAAAYIAVLLSTKSRVN